MKTKSSINQDTNIRFVMFRFVMFRFDLISLKTTIRPLRNRPCSFES